MDEQGVEQCFLFPTLGDCVEGLMIDEPEIGHKAFHAYNLWLEDDWGYGYKGRLWSRPTSRCSTRSWRPTSWSSSSSRGAKIVSVRPGPAAGRSQADPAFDRFWSIADEAQDVRRLPRLRRPHRLRRRLQGALRPGALQRQDLLRDAGARLQHRPRHLGDDHLAGARQPVRPVPERAGRLHRDGHAVGCAGAARGRPRRRASSHARISGLRYDDLGPAVATSSRRTSTCRPSPRRT